jgi:hypothetical protein
MVSRLQVLVLAALLSLSCGERPATQGKVNATVDGVVWMTGPVTGAVVSAYALDLDKGTPGELVGQSKPTDSSGAYHVDLGNHVGPLVLVAKGVGASYVEPATGVAVSWDSSTTLRSSFVEWTAGFDLNLSLASGAAATVHLSPWSEWATATSLARAQARRDRSYAEALRSATFRMRDHLEIDFWSVTPQVLTEKPVGAWNNQVQAGVATAALSALSYRMARDSRISTAGLSTLQLLSAVRDDLGDTLGLLDGQGVQGQLKVGTCSTVCSLSPRTLRANLSEAAADFLGSTANKSGVRVTDADAYLGRISARMSDLWPAGGDASFDTQPPTITVIGLQDADILHGTLQATVRVADAIEMGTATVTFSRAGSPVAGFYTATPTTPDAQTRVIALALRTTELADGPLLLHIEATDKAGNKAAPVEISLFLDNSPNGSVAGTVVIGGRLAGARVRAWEYVAAAKGKLLGETVSDAAGVYKVDVMDTTAQVILLEVDNPPSQAAAQYIEGTSGWRVTLSGDDRVESLLSGWRNGDKRPDGMVTPWTTLATAFARGLYGSPLYNQNPSLWGQAVDDAFGQIEDHFFTETTRVSLRADAPADLTTAGDATFGSQARYGLLIHALGQLSDQQARLSNATQASMNTLTLTRLLASDLSDDGRSSAPLWNGRTASGQLVHGRVNLTSYETRVNLAVAAVEFVTENPRYKAPFTQLDIAPFLDRISADGNPRLYPTSEPPLPYDTIKPDHVAFTAASAPDGTVLRGDVALEATAHDNRALASFAWSAPTTAGAITGIRLDQTTGLPGPWILGGVLHTDLLPEGNVTVTALATDQATNAASTSRTYVVDRTPPVLALASATTSKGAAIASGAWTAATTIVLKGTLLEAHLASATATVNGASAPLQVEPDGSWSVSVPMATTGTYSVALAALDAAGNAAEPLSLVFNCDATPPTIVTMSSAFVDDAGRTATVAGDAPGIVTYGNEGTQITLTSGVQPVFSKYADRYVSTSPSLPEWHFAVSDNHSTSPAIVTQGRLSRRTSDGHEVLLADWFNIPATLGPDFNRAEVVSSALHADVGQVDGTYTLEIRAVDELGNVSPVDCGNTIGCVSWQQKIRPPSLRQRAGTDTYACLDASIPTGHTLDVGGPCPSFNVTASVNLTGPDERKIAEGYIDNPNPFPVDVAIAATAQATIRRGLLFENIQVGSPSTINKVCDGTGIPDAKSSGACYTSKPNTDENGTDDVLDRDLVSGLSVTGATSEGVDVVGRPVYRIPAHSTAAVWLLSAPWSFLMPGAPADYPSVGSLQYVTGIEGLTWLQCVSEGADHFGNAVCNSQVLNQELTRLTRVSVRPRSSISLLSRSTASPEASWGPATGSSVSSFSYYNFDWDTQASGFAPF